MSEFPTFEIPHAERWTDTGSFIGADGRVVRAYDDVVFLRDAAMEDPVVAGDFVKTGETGTVLMFVPEHDGLAQIELNDRPHIELSFERQSFLRLHMTIEEKYPR